jgi:glycerophosphoryl diester phosphodiesterase
VRNRRLGPATAVAAFTVLATVGTAANAFDLEGHRGARGLRPENTLAAFAHASALGVSTLEMDLAVTRDGVLVISHDPFLNPDLVRGPDGRWLSAKGPAIHAQTLDELKRYDIGRLDPDSRYAKLFPQQQSVDGERFPTLVEVFDLVRTSGKPLRFNIETKLTPGSPDETVDPVTFARLVAAAVRNAKFESRVTIQSFDWRTLVALKQQAPDIETACLTSETDSMDTVQRKAASPSPWLAGLDLGKYGGSLPSLVKAAGCGTWSPFWRNVTPALVAEAAALGLKVLPWTVNDPADMARLIDMKVDGLITDYPDRLRTVMAGKGLPLP